jgi:hypothetical protein
MPAAVAHTFTDGDKSVTSSEAAVNGVGLVGGDKADDSATGTDSPAIDAAGDDTVSSGRRVVDKTTVDKDAADSDRHAPAPGKTSIDASGKDAEGLTTGLREPTHNAAKDADNDEPGTTVEKPGADAQKTDNKPRADATRASEKAGTKAGDE